MSQFFNFPTEILVKIFSELDSETLIEVSRTCSRFQEIIKSRFIWKNKTMEVSLKNEEELESFLELSPVFPEIKSLTLTLWTDCTDQVLRHFHSLTNLHLSIDIRRCQVPTFFKWNHHHHHLVLSLKTLHLKMNSCSHVFLLKLALLSQLKSLSLEGEEPVDIEPIFSHHFFRFMKKLTYFEIISILFLGSFPSGACWFQTFRQHLPLLVKLLSQETSVNCLVNFEYDKSEEGFILNQRFSSSLISDL